MRQNIRIKVLVCLLCLAMGTMAVAQTSDNITWKFAFLKGEIVSQTAMDLTQPIPMKSGEKFQLFMHVINSEAYVYILFNGLDGSVDVLANLFFPPDSAYLIPSPYQTFTVTPPSGTEKIYIVVSSERQEKLEALLAKTKRDSNAILDEVKSIQQSVSKVAEIPQKPVPIGGVVRGGVELLQATQFEGQNTYVRIIRIEH